MIPNYPSLVSLWLRPQVKSSRNNYERNHVGSCSPQYSHAKKEGAGKNKADLGHLAKSRTLNEIKITC